VAAPANSARATRRTFLATSVLAGASTRLAAAARLPIRKAVLFEMLPATLSVPERFQLARDSGFEQVECLTTPGAREAEALLAASRAAGVPIHSVMNRDHWRYPLSSPDADVVAKCVAGIEASLANAQLWGADTVLLVPAVVNPQTTYRQGWERSQAQIRKLIPLAAERKVILAIEEVWNKFLASPLEFARYIDEFESPWVRAYFDVGNVAISGYPQDWIRVLNRRIVKLHLKDFTFRGNIARFVNLRDGDIDWKEIYRALGEIGYQGSATVELDGGDAAYLRDVSRRADLILSGQ
jgi:L-ribulose-5-phosphate 3-epimerase